MESGKHFCYNGKLILSGKLIISADNRSFRFGDGFFETMKMTDGNIALSGYHFERLFSSLQLLKFERPDYFSVKYFSNLVTQIAKKNKQNASARIRLTIFRSDGGLYNYENNFPNYIIQTWSTDSKKIMLNEYGLVAGIYTKAKKSCDDFSHIKSNNYLPYVMAAMWAQENKMDDAIILNNYNRIAETTIANIFLVKDGKIKTPPLSEGCVNGVMRRYLMECFAKENIPFEETKIDADEMYEADELFVTNAVQQIKWIGTCDNHNYKHELVDYLYNEFLVTATKV